MKIYVAGPSQRSHHCQAVMRSLELQGHTVTWDWTQEFTNSHREMTAGRARQIAVRDLDGVKAADVLVLLLFEDVDSPGAATEVGYALALGQQVLVVYDKCYDPWRQSGRDPWASPFVRRQIFLAHPNVTFVTPGELDSLLEMVEALAVYLEHLKERFNCSPRGSVCPR